MLNTTAAVFVASDVDVDHDGDEMEVFHVFVGDNDGEPTSKVWTVRRGRAAAIALADRIGHDRNMEVVID